jgi:hypothetical protein
MEPNFVLGDNVEKKFFPVPGPPKSLLFPVSPSNEKHKKRTQKIMPGWLKTTYRYSIIGGNVQFFFFINVQ